LVNNKIHQLHRQPIRNSAKYIAPHRSDSSARPSPHAAAVFADHPIHHNMGRALRELMLGSRASDFCQWRATPSTSPTALCGKQLGDARRSVRLGIATRADPAGHAVDAAHPRLWATNLCPLDCAAAWPRLSLGRARPIGRMDWALARDCARLQETVIQWEEMGHAGNTHPPHKPQAAARIC